MLVYRNPHNICLYDGFSRMPKRKIDSLSSPDFRAIPVDFGDTIQTFHIGKASVGTPPLLALLFRAHSECGHLPLCEVLAPAIDAARNGVRLNELQASFIGLLQPILTDRDPCRELHTRDGELLKSDDYFRNPDLANILEMLCHEGIREMYEGDLARKIVASVESGGLLSMDDMRYQQTLAHKPLMTPLFDGNLLTNSPPSSGGILITFAALLLERLMRHFPDRPQTLLIAEALRETSRMRGHDFDHQVHTPGIAHTFLNPNRIDSSFEAIRQRLNGERRDVDAETENRHGSTTHISVVDHAGMAVSITTSNGEGSGIVVPGTGIHLNNMLGEEDINPTGFHRLSGGERLSSMMSPTILIKSGRPVLTLGSGGSNRLRGAILQVLSRHILKDESIEHAILAPRIHNEGNLLDVEPDGLTEETRHQLLELGWDIRDWQKQSVYFGGVHAICMDERGYLHGAGDPRRGGSVAWE